MHRAFLRPEIMVRRCAGKRCWARAARALVAGQIAAGLDRLEAAGAQELADGFALIESVLDQQPAPGVEVLRGARDDGANGVEAVDPGSQRKERLVPPSIQVRITGGDVRRV